MQKGFVFDINKCTGCQACSIACEIENELPPGADWRQVTTFNEAHEPGILSFHLSIACNHCVDAPCMEHCPALAYSKNAITGAVTVDPDRCIGCRYCTWACPWDAPRFNPSRGVVEKCTFCSHRLEDGLEPACVTSCPTGALKLSDHVPGFRNVPVPGFPTADAEPAIRIIPLRPGRVMPKAIVPEGGRGDRTPVAAPGAGSNASLSHEWMLVLFTLLVPSLFGVFVAVGELGGSARTGYVCTGVLGMAASAAHLGRWPRAHRAILNWRRSWLSREVILVSLFLATSSLAVLFGWTAGPPRWVAVLLGVGALFAIDQVYHVTRTRQLDFHSARALLTGLFFIGLFAKYPMAIFVAGGLKLVLYLYRKRRFAKEKSNPRRVLSTLRVTAGFIVPLALWFVGGVALWPYIIVFALAGEAIDRCEFYMELDVPTLPAVGDRDLKRELSRA